MIFKIKQPITFMQEVENYFTAGGDKLSDIIDRRSQPFMPEILKDYGFSMSIDERYFLNDTELVLNMFEVKIYLNYLGRCDFTFPLWKTIDEMENDLARVMESLK
jgi:hypothetical protein